MGELGGGFADEAHVPVAPEFAEQHPEEHDRAAEDRRPPEGDKDQSRKARSGGGHFLDSNMSC